MTECVLCEERNLRSFHVGDGEKIYHHCQSCDLRFLDKNYYLTNAEETARYRLHRNDLEDPGYRLFLEPFAAALAEVLPKQAHGLDFGAGPGPLLAELLKSRGHRVELYDPVFWPEAGCLQKKYDFVCTSEVVEHFHEPGKEWKLLKSLLQPTGVLGVMTLLFEEGMDFSSWFYRKDPTHVCFYSRKSFEVLREKYLFSEIKFLSSRIIMLKS